MTIFAVGDFVLYDDGNRKAQGRIIDVDGQVYTLRLVGCAMIVSTVVAYCHEIQHDSRL